MPNYDFQCSACKEIFEDIQLVIADRDQPCHEACPVCEQKGTIERLLVAPFIGDSMRQGRTNLSSTWTDKLTEIKSKHRGSTIKIPSPSRREF